MSLTGEYKGDCSITKKYGLSDENGTGDDFAGISPKKRLF